MNIAGGAVARHAKNRANAIKFLEYLASPEAQNYFANGNNEWPTAKGVTGRQPRAQGHERRHFKSRNHPAVAVGANQTKVQQMLDRVGYLQIIRGTPLRHN
jgi:iron(III) transport system substrate-binding protein